ncbi:protein FAR1-RELATED SEQUENCE 5-like [Magnolia sinica]|uniref:protein FAR1-RELATED SEQUENCE 5-like n=1 Tax=Magnolia sinica TaxID=86752 RepID=UPI0026599CD6|nr:protein FAR1-RELATED SEQUENCE 5-like [Magnolia sinica]
MLSVFDFSIRKEHVRKHDGLIYFCQWVCWREGYRDKRHFGRTNGVRKERAITRVGCKASRTAVKEKNGKWIVKEFVEEHNHETVASPMVHLLRSHRSFGDIVTAQLKNLRNAGAPTNVVMSYLTEEIGRNRNIGITSRDCKNWMGSERKNIPKTGDEQVVLDYCVRMKDKDTNFFYEFQVNDENRMTTLFWVDSRARMDYDCFGDVVKFDTTYKTNRYGMPFAPFTGVNHHRQPVFFGCAWLLDETESSFIWLIQTWLKAMHGRHPVSIITDEDAAIAGAIAKVLPNIRHCFCLCHISQNVAKNLSHLYRKGNDFAKAFSKVVSTKGSIENFESRWVSLLIDYNLSDNHWLRSMYDKRHQWVLVFLRDTFFANMLMTKRSESMTNFFYGYVHAKTTFHEFVNQYERALKDRRGAEIEEDFKAIHSEPVLKSLSLMEKEAAQIYTISMFERFKKELDKREQYIAEKVEENDTSCIYKVTKYQEKIERSSEENITTYSVTFNTLET